MRDGPAWYSDDIQHKPLGKISHCHGVTMLLYTADDPRDGMTENITGFETDFFKSQYTLKLVTSPRLLCISVFRVK